MINIYIDDLVGNLLITLKSNGFNAKKLSYELIENYGVTLRDKLLEKDINPSLILSRDGTDKFLFLNENLYSESDDKMSIIVIKNLSLDELILKYRGILSPELLYAMINKDVIAKTIAAYTEETNVVEAPKLSYHI